MRNLSLLGSSDSSFASCVPFAVIRFPAALRSESAGPLPLPRLWSKLMTLLNFLTLLGPEAITGAAA
jgi:hypothetical protein